MSDGTDTTVGIAESGSPTSLIDNSLMASGAKRQRVDAPTIADLMGDVVMWLQMLVSRTPLPDPTTLTPRAPTTTPVTVSSGTVTTVSTVTTCSTVASLTNVAGVGGLNTQYDQVSQINSLALLLRGNGIVTT